MNTKRINIDDNDEPITWLENMIGTDRYSNYLDWKYDMWKKCWYDTKLADLYYNIKHGLYNFWTWRTVIWNDRNWDGDYILKILEHKINVQRDNIYSKDRHADSGEVSDKMKECTDLIRRVLEDKYADEDMEIHKEKYGECKFEFVPSDEVDCKGNNLFKMNMSHEKVTTPEIEIEERNEFSRIMREAQHKKEIDRRDAMDILSMHVDEWWE